MATGWRKRMRPVMPATFMDSTQPTVGDFGVPTRCFLVRCCHSALGWLGRDEVLLTGAIRESETGFRVVSVSLGR